MNEKWHIVALAVTASVCTTVFATYAFAIAYFIWIFILYYKQRITQVPFVVATAFFSLVLFLVPSINDDTEHIESATQKEVTGKITKPLNRKERVFESVMKEEESGQQILLIFFPEDQTVENEIILPYGATCTIQGTIELASTARNPGQFDYQQYLRSQGISHQFIIQSTTDISCAGQSPLHIIHFLRERLISFIGEHMNPEVGRWLRALVLGDTSGLDQEVIQLFQRWGLSHILAISGLHVGLIVGLLYAVLVKTGLTTKETASYVLIAFIPFYMILAGAQPSVLRAGLMVFLFLILQAWFRAISTTDGLSIVFIFLVCIDPYIVYHLGFQFSFMTTFALLLSRTWLLQTPSIGWNIAQISFIAQMAILPLQLNAFYVFQPFSIVLNIIIVTYFSITIIPFLFLYAMLYPLWAPVSTFIDSLFVRIHSFVLQFIEYVDNIGLPPMVIGSVSFLSSMMYYILLIMMMIAVQQQKLTRSFLSGVLLVSLLTAIQIGPYLSKEGTVTMLDIGQGDALVIELPYRKGVIMVDAGATFSFDDRGMSDRNVTQVIEPYLHSRGINKIDALIISHEDLDHNGSAPYLMDNFDVDHYLISSYYELNEIEEFAVQANGVQVHRVKATDQIDILGQIIHVVSPSTDYHEPNPNSLTIVTELGGNHWIFTGDINSEQEEMIVRQFPEISIDVWKVAHHGSHTSSSEKAIRHYKPDVFLIPVGENNRYGHPAKEVIDRLEATGGIIYRTDLHGAIQYQFKESTGTFTPFIHTLWINKLIEKE